MREIRDAARQATAKTSDDPKTESDLPVQHHAAATAAGEISTIQRVEDVSRIEDLSDVPDEELQRMMEIRDAARQANAKTSDDS